MAPNGPKEPQMAQNCSSPQPKWQPNATKRHPMAHNSTQQHPTALNSPQPPQQPQTAPNGPKRPPIAPNRPPLPLILLFGTKICFAFILIVLFSSVMRIHRMVLYDICWISVIQNQVYNQFLNNFYLFKDVKILTLIMSATT